MSGEMHGEVMHLTWPDGNDEGVIYVRGHVDDDSAREAVLGFHDEAMESIAIGSLGLRGPLSDQDRAAIEAEMRRLADGARVERVYARWSMEADDPLENGWLALREYRSRGRGRFPVTRVTAFPDTPCHVVFTPDRNTAESGERTGVCVCRKCGRRWIGRGVRSPGGCPRLVGDERYTPGEVIEELDPDGEYRFRVGAPR